VRHVDLEVSSRPHTSRAGATIGYKKIADRRGGTTPIEIGPAPRCCGPADVRVGSSWATDRRHRCQSGAGWWVSSRSSKQFARDAHDPSRKVMDARYEVPPWPQGPTHRAVPAILLQGHMMNAPIRGPETRRAVRRVMTSPDVVQCTSVSDASLEHDSPCAAGESVSAAERRRHELVVIRLVSQGQGARFVVSIALSTSPSESGMVRWITKKPAQKMTRHHV